MNIGPQLDQLRTELNEANTDDEYRAVIQTAYNLNAQFTEQLDAQPNEIAQAFHDNESPRRLLDQAEKSLEMGQNDESLLSKFTRVAKGTPRKPSGYEKTAVDELVHEYIARVAELDANDNFQTTN